LTGAGAMHKERGWTREGIRRVVARAKTGAFPKSWTQIGG